MIPKEFETISEYVCKQTRWTDGSIRHDRMEDVVRCKDCIVFGTHGKNTDICPMWHNTRIDPCRDFCSRGVRRTEPNSSEKPNNSTISKMEQVDEPQTEHLEQFRVGLEYHTDTTHFGKTKGESVTTNKIEDEPQTERSE